MEPPKGPERSRCRKLLGPVLVMKQAGYDSPGLHLGSQLVFDCAATMRDLIVRPTDVPTHVEHGAADVGVVGKDVLLEQGRSVYEPLDLKVGACRISVAAFAGPTSPDRWSSKIRGDKYPNVTERYFNQRGVPVRLSNHGVNRTGSLVGLADRIVDLVETGVPLRPMIWQRWR